MGVVALLRHYGVRRDGFTKDGGYTTETGQAASRPFDTSRWLVGSPTRARTWDLRINSPSLYQLSYRGIGNVTRATGGILQQPPALLNDFGDRLRDVVDVAGVERGDTDAPGLDGVDGVFLAQPLHLLLAEAG